MKDSTVISPPFHHTPLGFHSFRFPSPPLVLSSTHSNYLFSLCPFLFSLSISCHSPFFLSAISSHTCTFSFFAPFISTFSSNIHSFVSPFLVTPSSFRAVLSLSSPLLPTPLRASHQIIPLPPRQCVLITLCHLYTWTGGEEVET